MNKNVYVAPVMEVITVRLEQGFMKASIFEPDENFDKGFSIKGHEVGADDDYSFNDPSTKFDENTWD